MWKSYFFVVCPKSAWHIIIIHVTSMHIELIGMHGTRDIYSCMSVPTLSTDESMHVHVLSSVESFMYYVN